jgi:uncharacterized damage-inducible protein DinB
MISEKERFMKVWDNEFKTTLKVLKAYPLDKQDLKPHPVSKSAKELAWGFAAEEKKMVPEIMDGTVDFSGMPKAPSTMKEVITEYDEAHKKTMQKFEKMSDEDLNKKMKFFVAPKKMDDMRRIDVLWGMMMDEIHHRGQFSVYLRMAGGKVPSIYGPTADEAWT